MIQRIQIDGQTYLLEGGAGHWVVQHGDQQLGEVREYVQHFNLRRVIVIRGWRAFPNDGGGRHLLSPYRRDPDGNHGSDYSCFNTRREAVEALVRFWEADRG